MHFKKELVIELLYFFTTLSALTRSHYSLFNVYLDNFNFNTSTQRDLSTMMEVEKSAVSEQFNGLPDLPEELEIEQNEDGKARIREIYLLILITNSI